MKGFYISLTSEPPNPKIKDWNVTELKVRLTTDRVSRDGLIIITPQIDPHRRHVDKSVVAHFWRILDQWTSTYKPSLVQG